MQHQQEVHDREVGSTFLLSVGKHMLLLAMPSSGIILSHFLQSTGKFGGHFFCTMVTNHQQSELSSY